MSISASWIWSDDSAGKGYNLCSIFRRDFRLEKAPASARILISADSVFRLKVNGQWIADGPARGYPEHYYYDILDLGGLLRAGANQIEAVVRYYGCGTFHQLPQRGGFLAQIELTDPDETILTDEAWYAAPLTQWVVNTVKSSVQQSPYEIYDASLPEKPEWKNAVKICGAEEGPWKNLRARDVKTLSRREFLLRRFAGVARVPKEPQIISFSLQKLFFPGDVTLNCSSTFPVIASMIVHSPQSQMVHLGLLNAKVSVNGRTALNGEVALNRGRNLLVMGSANLDGHRHECEVAFPAEAEVTLGNCYDETGRVALVDLPELRELTVLDTDEPRFRWANTGYQERQAAFFKLRDSLLALKTVGEFKERCPEARLFEPAELVKDPNLPFSLRKPFRAEPGDVLNPNALLYPDDDCTTVVPPADCDIELCYDLGEQNVGYWNFALFAAAGTVIDIAAVEYVTPDGRVQDPYGCYRNSMRYICREGYNRYISYRRRSGRYLFITIRNAAAPVKIQFLRLVESTYPVVFEGEFNASDYRLNRIYEISALTMKLCTEDTFTDCPLYEQTLWVGDARNEGLFAMSSFGAYDVVRRCIRLAADSLCHLPLVGCQVPSGWGSIIPIWSFMWVISVWDYYFETADKAFCREIWPDITLNLDNAWRMIDPETGLFRSEGWNLFDWSKTNCSHAIMIQNSMFLAGALNAAVSLGEALGEDVAPFRDRLEPLKKAVNAAWDSRKLAWPDSIRETGPSEDISMHTSMLSLLYDVADDDHRAAARANTVTPRPELIKVSSPFAALYLYEALEKIGMPDEIMKAVYRDYLPMLRIGSTTVWETFARAFSNDEDFPTRSHCHGWSAAPLYVLPRLVLGILPVEPGMRKVVISPRLGELEYASGARPTVHGRIEVRWQKRDGKVEIRATAPAEVELEYRTNDTLDGYEVTFNGETV